jgi:hypothetical protein
VLTTPSLFGPDPTVATAGEAFEILSARSWVLRLPRELKTPNRTIWRDWRTLASDRNGWERLIEMTLRTWRALLDNTTWSPLERATWPHVVGHREHRRMTIRRLLPSRANFTRDDRNLQFAPKGLEDALVRQRLLAGDSDDWLTSAPVTQHVSPDGQFYTVVLLERPAIAGAEVTNGR